MNLHYLQKCLSWHKTRTLSLLAAMMMLSAIPSSAQLSEITFSPSTTMNGEGTSATDFKTQDGNSVTISLTSTAAGATGIAFTVDGTLPMMTKADGKTTFTVTGTTNVSIGTLAYADGKTIFTPTSGSAVDLGDKKVVTVSARAFNADGFVGAANVAIYRLADAGTGMPKYIFQMMNYYSPTFGINNFPLYALVVKMDPTKKQTDPTAVAPFSGPVHYSFDNGQTWSTAQSYGVPKDLTMQDLSDKSKTYDFIHGGWTAYSLNHVWDPEDAESYVNNVNFFIPVSKEYSQSPLMIMFEGASAPQRYDQITALKSRGKFGTAKDIKDIKAEDKYIIGSTSNAYLNYRHNNGMNINGTNSSDFTWWLSPDWTFSDPSSKVTTIDENWNMFNRKADVVNIAAGSTASQTVSGLPATYNYKETTFNEDGTVKATSDKSASSQFKVQAIVRAVDASGNPVADKNIKISVNGVEGTCFSGDAKGAWVNYAGMVDNFAQTEDYDNNYGWRIVDAIAAPQGGKVTITLTAPQDANLQVSDVTLLQNPDTPGDLDGWRTVGISLKQDEITTTDSTYVDETDYKNFSFFRIGDNANAVCYSAPLTIIGMNNTIKAPAYQFGAPQSSPAKPFGPKKIKPDQYNFEVETEENQQMFHYFFKGGLVRNNAVFPLKTKTSGAKRFGPHKVLTQPGETGDDTGMGTPVAQLLALTEIGADGSTDGNVFRSTGHPFWLPITIQAEKITYDRKFQKGKKYAIVLPFTMDLGGDNGPNAEINVYTLFGKSTKVYRQLDEASTNVYDHGYGASLSFTASEHNDEILAYTPIIIEPTENKKSLIIDTKTIGLGWSNKTPTVKASPKVKFAGPTPEDNKTLMISDSKDNNASFNVALVGTLSYKKLPPYYKESTVNGKTVYEEEFDKSWTRTSSIPADVKQILYLFWNGKFNIVNRIYGANCKPFHAYVVMNQNIIKRLTSGDTNATITAKFLDAPLELTGINEVETKVDAPADGHIFSIDGRLVSTDGNAEGLQPGMYIMNGKKFIVR